MRTMEMVGGPFDGLQVPNTGGYFVEGDLEAVNSKDLATPGSGWSAESVYVVRSGRLVYDEEQTRVRAGLADRAKVEEEGGA